MSETTKSMTVSRTTTMQQMKSNDISSFLSNYDEQIAKALPKHLTSERLIQITTTVLSTNPALKKCTAVSLIGAVLQSAALGFDPTPTLGYCYFVPYGSNIQLQIGYKGYMELARRSNEISEIYAHCVYADDYFHYEYGLNRTLEHRPSKTKKEAKNITHVYAVAKLKDGGTQYVVLDKEEVEALRLRSPMQKVGKLGGAWATDYDKMAMAKAVKQLAKFLPLNTDIRSSIASDEQVITPEHIQAGKYMAENARPDNVDEDGVVEEAEVIDPTDEAEDYLKGLDKEMEQEDEG